MGDKTAVELVFQVVQAYVVTGLEPIADDTVVLAGCQVYDGRVQVGNGTVGGSCILEHQADGA